METKIYIDRLKEGRKESFQGSMTTRSFPNEDALRFEDTLQCKGEAYIAGDHLVLKLQAQVQAEIPCAICNEWTKVTLQLKDFMHTEPLEEIPSGVFDFAELMRTDLLLELPQFAECQGNCPERATVKSFIRSSDLPEGTHFPFSGL